MMIKAFLILATILIVGGRLIKRAKD